MTNITASGVAPTGKAAAVVPPKPSQQKLIGLDVQQLKNLRDVSLDLGLSPLTAIMGGNCSGKTTVLHALACAYRPPDQNAPDYKFPQFFRPNTDALWQGSRFTVRYSERVTSTVHPNLSQLYEKVTDRWSPRYTNRPVRYTRFINIGGSVPDIETLTLNTMMHYRKTERSDEVGKRVRDVAGQILNRTYDNLYDVTYNYRGMRSIGVKTGSITYSGLSMSSGEQRVFRILNATFRAPDYALLLVDEIDLFLHQDALQRLLSKLHDHCEKSHKQLIFTTHFPPIAEMYDKMSILTLSKASTGTVVWRGYSYEALRQITGKTERPISCYVEDDVAEAIVARVAEEVGIRKFVQVGHYGPASNAFTMSAGLLLSNTDMSSTLAILDGDAFVKKVERIERAKKAITGTGATHEDQRRRLVRLVRPLKSEKNSSGKFLAPEQMLHKMLCGITPTNIPDDRKELFEIVLSIVNVPEKHGLVNEIINHTGEPRGVALSKIVELSSKADEWMRYTRVIRRWMVGRKAALNL